MNSLIRNGILAVITLIILLLLSPGTGMGEELTEVINFVDGSEMVLVPEGDFYMGSKGDEYPMNEKPRHKVYLDAFYIDKYEVTNEMFARFLSTVRPEEKIEGIRWEWVILRSDLATNARAMDYPTEIVYRDGMYIPVKGFERYPVISVSWYAAEAYCTWAGKRLPTEAEWEKAARGGLDNEDFPWGDQMPTFDCGVVFGKKWLNNLLPPPTEKVGNYPYNGYGIFDMAGNVAEWCSDWYSSKYYGSSPDKNPKGPEKGKKKVIRGGSWSSLPINVRIGLRTFDKPAVQSDGIGIRCAKDAVDKEE